MTANSNLLASELDELIENLQKYSKALKEKDRESLEELLKEGSDRKISIDTRGSK